MEERLAKLNELIQEKQRLFYEELMDRKTDQESQLATRNGVNEQNRANGKPLMSSILMILLKEPDDLVKAKREKKAIEEKLRHSRP
ncbi:MAG: hypothetical protein LBQ43_00855 [Holosporales bacterium]|nr:hypothetical protein [Holosporales bacterium]